MKNKYWRATSQNVTECYDLMLKKAARKTK